MAALARRNLRLVGPSRVEAGRNSARSPQPESAGSHEPLDAARLRVRYDNLEAELDAQAGILWGTMLHRSGLASPRA